LELSRQGIEQKKAEALVKKATETLEDIGSELAEEARTERLPAKESPA